MTPSVPDLRQKANYLRFVTSTNRVFAINLMGRGVRPVGSGGPREAFPFAGRSEGEAK
jgi:hypothetical protein